MTMTVGSLLGTTVQLAARDRLAAIGAIAALTVLAVFIDQYANNATLIFTLASVAAHFYLLRHVLIRFGYVSAERVGSFGSFFGAGILTGLGTLFGFVALVIPGLFLASRWGMTNAAILAEDQSATAAMARSWDATKGHSVTVMVTLAVLLLPGLIGLAGLVATAAYAIPLDDAGWFGWDVAANTLVSASQVLSWYFEVALFALLVGSPADTLNDVFA